MREMSARIALQTKDLEQTSPDLEFLLFLEVKVVALFLPSFDEAPAFLDLAGHTGCRCPVYT